MADAAEQAGLSYRVSPEVEFFLFEAGTEGGAQPVTRDVGGYFDRSADRDRQVREEVVKVIEGMGVEVEASHHEVAPGQHEIDLYPQQALASADAVATLRWVARSVAQRHSLHASFMPKPLTNQPGSGMHVHQTLVGPSGEDLFSEPSRPYGLSDLACHFIAGQLAHARAIAAIAAPLVNSYKRLVPGYEAPTNLTWARANRSALIRVPERAAREALATRVELRLPDSSCNPYLTYAAMLGAGLDGIEQQLPLPEPIEELPQGLEPARRFKFNVPTLPTSLEEALEQLEADTVIAEVLGQHLLEHFVDAKRMEWESYRTQVTTWELRSYLALY